MHSAMREPIFIEAFLPAVVWGLYEGGPEVGSHAGAARFQRRIPGVWSAKRGRFPCDVHVKGFCEEVWNQSPQFLEGPTTVVA